MNYYEEYNEYDEYNDDNQDLYNQNINEEPNTMANKKLVPKSKNTTYADIYSNLNIIIVDGKLKLVHKNENTVNSYFLNNQNNSYNPQIQPQQTLQGPIQPLTPEQMKKINTIKYMNWLKEKQRISQLKPKNMFFNNGNVPAPQQNTFAIKQSPAPGPGPFKNFVFKKKI